MARLPLEGIRVLDLTVVWSGPLTTKILGELGAEVIRLESIYKFPASTKGTVPYPPPELLEKSPTAAAAYPNRDPGDKPFNRHAMFNQHATNKKAFTAELDTPEGQEALRKMIEISDVLIENNAIRVGKKLGYDHETVKRINPRMIIMRMPPVGISGPYEHIVGFGTHFEALSGVTLPRGYKNADPSKTPINYHMDDASGVCGAFAIMAAIHWRNRTGRGMFIEFPQVENMLNQMGEAFLDYSMNGRSPEPHGNDHPFYVQGVYPCLEREGEDNWIAIVLENDAQWEQLRGVMGEPEWTREERFSTIFGIRRHQDEFNQLLSQWTRGQDKYELFHRLQQLGIACSPLIREDDAFADPHVKARDYFKPLTHPEAGTHLYPGHLFKYSDLKLKFERHAPRLGEDNEYVYKELLGYTEEQYQDLWNRGLIGDAYPRPDESSASAS